MSLERGGRGVDKEGEGGRGVDKEGEGGREGRREGDGQGTDLVFCTASTSQRHQLTVTAAIARFTQCMSAHLHTYKATLSLVWDSLRHLVEV